MSDTTLAHVNPGDRITADYINGIVDAVNELQAEIDALGTPSSGNGPVITALQPPDQVAIGDELDVIGRNFGVPANQNVVTLDGSPVTGFLPGSSDTVLKLAVPPVAGAPKDAELAVQTTAGTATHIVHIVPATVVPEGHPTITNATGSIGTVTAGNTSTFSFQVDASDVSIAETYDIEVTFANAAPASVPASAWLAAMTVVGASNGEVTITPGAPVTIGVRIDVPAGASAVDLSFQAISVHNDPGSSASATPVHIEVGQAPPPSDPRIQPAIGTIGQAAAFRAAQIPVPGSPGSTLNGIEVQYPAPGTVGGRLVQIPIDITCQVASTLSYAVSIESNDATLWTLGVVTPSEQTYAAGAAQQVHVALTLLASAASSELRFLDFVATRQDADSIGPISNYLRFPITGYSN